MKDNNAKLGLLIAALLTMGQTSNAQDSRVENKLELFRPIETLAPEHRAALFPQVDLLRKTVKIDWESVIIGINQNGELTLKGKLTQGNGTVASPTCWAE